MIYVGYSRDVVNKPSNLQLPNEILNDRNYEGTFLYQDSLYLADNSEQNALME